MLMLNLGHSSWSYCWDYNNTCATSHKRPPRHIHRSYRGCPMYIKIKLMQTHCSLLVVVNLSFKLSYVVFLMLLQDVDSPTPSTVEAHGSWSVHFDHLQLLQQPTGTFADALKAWLAIFWVFQMQYLCFSGKMLHWAQDTSQWNCSTSNREDC